MKICITGYRPSKLPQQYGYNIHNAAWQGLKRAFMDVSLFLWGKQHSLTIYTGMALGVDQAFAEAAFELKQQVPNITIEAAVPCYNQEVKWPISSRELYHSILDRCDNVVHVTKSTFTNDCMETRNRYMVDRSEIVVGVYDGKSGGTKNCINYALKQKKGIITIHPVTLQIYCNKNILE